MNTRTVAKLKLTLLVAATAAAMSAGTRAPTAMGAALLSGVVQTGGTQFRAPLGRVPVTLYEASESQATALATTTTDVFGHFELTSSVDTSSGVFFASADLGDGVELISVLGESLPSETTINELTTVAAAYSMAQFMKSGAISGDEFGLRVAAGMSRNIASPETGESSPVLSTSPNADETTSLRATRSLANLVAACVRRRSVARTLFRLTTPPGGPAPTHVAQALADLARAPWTKAAAIHRLTRKADLYRPALTRAPDAWTVVVKVNDSGDDAVLFGGPANIAFDAKGYAWVTNNVVQGKTTSAYAIMVLKPDGSPADGTGGTPRSPITGGGLLGPGFGVCIDPAGTVWVGDFGWGGVDPSATGAGSVSRFAADGQAISPSDGYQGGPVRAQGMQSDAAGNIWIASFGNDRVYVFPAGDPSRSVFFQETTGDQPFDLKVAADGSCWVVNGGGFDGQYASSVAKFTFAGGVIQQQFRVPLGKALKGMSLDSLGNAWVASQNDSKIYGVRPDGTVIGGFTGGGTNGPWSVTVDGEDNLWVADFGPLKLGDDFKPGRISKLCGANPATWPRGGKTGAPITPKTGCTVPTAGDMVRLHDGEPLYGRGGPPCFQPLMRLTNDVIDRAGNVWAINNWKPSFNIDVLSNPGGDGILIFVGLAPPKRP